MTDFIRLNNSILRKCVPVVILVVAALCMMLVNVSHTEAAPQETAFTDAKPSEKVKLEVSQAEAKPGQTVAVTVKLSENPGISGFGFRLRYDDKILTPEAVDESQDVFKTEAVVNKDGKDSKGSFIGYFTGTASNVNGNGIIITVSFRVSSEVKECSTKLILDELDICNADLETVEAEKTDGSVMVEAIAGETEGVGGGSPEAGSEGFSGSGSSSGQITDVSGTADDEVAQIKDTDGKETNSDNSTNTQNGENSEAEITTKGSSLQWWTPSTDGGIKVAAVLGVIYALIITVNVLKRK